MHPRMPHFAFGVRAKIPVSSLHLRCDCPGFRERWQSPCHDAAACRDLETSGSLAASCRLSASDWLTPADRVRPLPADATGDAATQFEDPRTPTAVGP